MKLYIINNYKEKHPNLSGKILTDATITDKISELGYDNFVIARTDNGKPYLVGNSELPYISVSHTEDMFAIAVSDCEIGIDLQNGRPVNAIAIAERYFTETEQAMVTEQGTREFYRLWCRKEAFAKYTGEGMAQIMAKQEVIDREDVFFIDMQISEEMFFAACMAKDNDEIGGEVEIWT